MFYLRIAHDDEVQLPSCFFEAEQRRIREEEGEVNAVYDVVEETIKASRMLSCSTAIDVHGSRRGAIIAKPLNQFQERKLMEKANMIGTKKKKHPKWRKRFSRFISRKSNRNKQHTQLQKQKAKANLCPNGHWKVGTMGGRGC